MQKRVVTKIGDVFKTPDGEYLQLVAIDEIQLYGDVIVFYGRINPITEPNPAILFYQHTVVSAGVKCGFWEKVGKCELPDISKLRFKQLFDKDTAEMLHEFNKKQASGFSRIKYAFKKPKPYWTTWNANDNHWKKIGFTAGNKLDAENGSIVPAADIYMRIKLASK